MHILTMMGFEGCGGRSMFSFSLFWGGVWIRPSDSSPSNHLFRDSFCEKNGFQTTLISKLEVLVEKNKAYETYETYYFRTIYFEKRKTSFDLKQATQSALPQYHVFPQKNLPQPWSPPSCTAPCTIFQGAWTCRIPCRATA